MKGIVRNSHYYNIAHCSKVLQPGAVRLGTKGYTSESVTYQWYRNPDGSYAIILLNEGTTNTIINFVSGKVSLQCYIPARCIQSILWKE